MTTSLDGTIITPTSGGSLTDSLGEVYTMVRDAGQVTSASVYLNGNFIPGSGGTGQCTIVGGVVWAEEAPSGPWFTLVGTTFTQQAAGPPPLPPPPPPPTPTPTPTTTITAQLKAALAAVTDTVAQGAAAQTKLTTDFAAASTVLTNDFNSAQAKINADLQSAVTQLNLLLTEI